MKPKRGEQIDDWTLIARLGGGGSSSVWLAEHAEHGEAALKILTHKAADRRRRFAAEITVMQKLGERPGILPLIAAKVPGGDREEPAWLASPQAEVARRAIGDSPTLQSVVEAVLEWGRTLAELAGRGIGHRDVKPANLFRYRQRWCLGDFGLATYPEKEAITVPSQRLGPLYFMAPEMLREPDVAEFGPADVFSLAKTLWALVSGELYPPEGQIRAELASHDLRHRRDEPGALALGVILEAATAPDPAERPTMANLGERLQEWTEGGGARDDRAAAELRERSVDGLLANLTESFDEEAIPELESKLRSGLAEARREIGERKIQAEIKRRQDAENWRQALVDSGEATHLLSLMESVWPGPVADGRDWSGAVLAHPAGERTAVLEESRRLALGRPLWWLHSVILIGSLRLRDEDGCEPLASELAGEAARNHLLEFADTPALAASWRLQRALAPAAARLIALAPIEQLKHSAKSQMPAARRADVDHIAPRLFMIAVNETVRRQLRAVQPWSAEGLDAAAAEAEAMLGRVPIPESEWIGPFSDPWLLSWSDASPIESCGLAILAGDPSGDDLLADADLREVILERAREGPEHRRRYAEPLAQRLGLQAGDHKSAAQER